MTLDSASRSGHPARDVSNSSCVLNVSGETAVLSLRGEMDLASVERFEQVANEALATGPSTWS
jgi:hypothetical protein